MSEDDTVLVRNTQVVRESLDRLVRTLENWAVKESVREDFELAAFSSVLAEGIINFDNISTL